LGERINNLVNACKAIKSSLCEKYQNILSHLYDEITDQRDKMYSSLGKSNQEEDEILNRRKRGLMNFMGTGMHYLFGVCDDECSTKTSDAIMRTEKSGTNVLHITKQQTTVLKATIQQIEKTINQSQTLYADLKETETNFVNNLKKLGNTTETIMQVLQSTELQNIYTLLINLYAYETSTLNQIVLAARSGVIHSSLMTIQDIAKALTSIKNRFTSRKLEIPMGTKPSEVYELQKITKMTVFYGNNRIVFITKIPLVTDTEFTTFSIIPLPTRTDGLDTLMVIDSATPYAAITKDRRQYTTFSNEQMNECTQTDIYRICSTDQPVLKK